MDLYKLMYLDTIRESLRDREVGEGNKIILKMGG